MVQINPPLGCNLGPKFPTHAGHLSEKNDYLAVQYEDVHDLAQGVVYSAVSSFLTTTNGPQRSKSF